MRNILVATLTKLSPISSASPTFTYTYYRQRYYLNTKFSSSSRRNILSKKKKNDPFEILGITKTEDTSYNEVKKAFLVMALKHHPDTITSSEEKEEKTKLFIDVKKAFDQIKSNENGIAVLILKAEEEAQMTNDEYESWFYNETGTHSPNIGELNLSKEVIREVSELMSNSEKGSNSADDMGAGELDRSGGIWAMAKMISQDAKNSSNVMGGVLRIEEGEKKSVLNRRRRRR